MFRNKRSAQTVVTVLFLCVAVGVLAPTVKATESELHVLASTAWTAAIAEAAGAQEVEMLAPFELRHPPERDFRPSDIVRAVSADAIVWAGYEGFIPQLIAAADIPDERSVQIQTQNTPDHLIALTRDLAARWGTEAKQAVWEKQFVHLTDCIAANARRQDVGSLRAVVVGHLVAHANWLGYDVVGTFGFEEMTPAKVYELTMLEPDLIIDVWHNPTAEALAAASRADYIMLINFPGRDDTRSLLDVFTHNAEQLGLAADTCRLDSESS